MWRRGGRSAALDRAQALLSAKRNSRGDGEPVQRSPASTWEHTSAGGVSVKARSVPLNTHTLLSDVSDLSSASSASEHGAAGKIQGGEAGSPKDLRPQSSMGGERGGGGSRFLKKKAPPAAAISSSSSSIQLVGKSQMEQPPHLRGSQTAALSRLADIESRIRSRKQVGQLLKPASDLGTSPTPAPPVPPAAAAPQSVRLSPQSSGEQSPRGKRFLKSSRVEGVNTSKPAGPHVGAGSRSRAADAADPSVGSEMRRLTGVSLESDEEDMKKLLGDSLDSIDTSYLPHGRPKPTRTADEMAIRSGQKVSSSPPPPAAVPPSSCSSSISSPRSPASPFRFTGRTQAHFSSSALSLPPSPPCASPSPPGSPSLRRPLSSLSSSSVVLSLAELFPVGPGDAHSETSVVSTDDFKMNVLMLDDLLPVELGFTETKPDKEEKSELASPVPASPTQQQLLRYEEDQEEAPDYESDFESESRRTEAEESRVSERRPARGHDEELVSEVTEPSHVSRGRAEDVYSDTFSDAGSSYTSPASPDPSGRTSGESRSRGSRSSSGGRSRRRDSAGKVLKDAAVQAELAPPTYSWPAALLSVGPAVGATCPDPTPVTPHLSPETVEALGSFNPAAFVLNELLKQQLATTRRFIESSRQLHASLVRSLGPPNYRYTTLEDTLEHIRKLRPPRPTVQGRLK